MITKLQAAVGYASRDWEVFPLAPGSKLPLIPARDGGRGVHDATDDWRQVQAWWKAHPQANIGIATGLRSAIFVLDVDGEAGEMSLLSLEDRHGRLPATATVTTPRGGRHLYFSCEDDELRNSAGRLGTGVDTRGEGGYVVAPPSVVGGRRYEWSTHPRTPLAPVPGWLKALLIPKPPPPVAAVPKVLALDIANRALREHAERVLSAPVGTRNNTLNRAGFCCGQLVAAGVLDAGDVEAVLGEAARRVGLGEREIVATLASGLSAGMASPR